MFIRKKLVHSKRTGVSSAYYRLMESRNTEKGPRNTLLLHLGRLDITNEEQEDLIDRLSMPAVSLDRGIATVDISKIETR